MSRRSTPTSSPSPASPSRLSKCPRGRSRSNYDELGPGVQAFVQLEQGTFRLWNNTTDPAGRSLVVLASPGEPMSQVTALLTALDLPGRFLTQLWTGQSWLTGADASTSEA